MKTEPDEQKPEYKEKSVFKDKSMWLSMIASWTSFILNFAVSFYLTPYLINSVGKVEYSFFPLASTFISYIGIVTVALNSMQSRFVTIALHRKDTPKALEYINAVFWTNLMFSFIMIPLGVIFILYIDKFLVVPPSVKFNVQVLFSFVLFSLIVGLLTNFYTMSTYYKDKLYLSNFADMVGKLVYVAVGIGLFSLLPAKVYYVSIMNLSSFIVVFWFNYSFTKKFMPEIRLSTKYYKFERVKELISSGIWNSVTQLSNILLGGIDLLLANLYLGPEYVTLMSVSKTLPNQVCSIIGTAGNIFQPRFARQFAHDDRDALYKSLLSSIRLLGVIACIPMGALFGIGIFFFKLWVPVLDPRALQILSVIAIATLCISITIQPVYSVFIIVNKLKLVALVTLGTGILSLAIIFVLLHVTDVGWYKTLIIVCTSQGIGIGRNLFFTIPYAAHCIGASWKDFFLVVLRNMFLLGISVILFYIGGELIEPNSWIKFIMCILVVGSVNIVLLWFTALNKNERNIFKEIILSRIKRTGKGL